MAHPTSPSRPAPEPPGPGQRSVWSFPRPPAVELEPRRVVVRHAGETVADTMRAVKVLETSHPPTYYIPPEDVRTDLLRRRDAGGSVCEWKGRATYYDVAPGRAETGATGEQAAFCYDDPTARFRAHAGWISFYASRVDECLVGAERVTPQPGDFYSGWITSDLAGPFKGSPGSWGW